jgi:hypothetical protein
MESESKNIIQMLKNVKNIIDVSKGRGCWNDEELKTINITYHNVSEIARQLQADKPEEPKRFEEIKEDDKKLDESIEQAEEMDEVD